MKEKAKAVAKVKLAQKQLSEMQEQFDESLRRVAYSKMASCLSSITGGGVLGRALVSWKIARASGTLCLLLLGWRLLPPNFGAFRGEA